jgi:hypothetical protein
VGHSESLQAGSSQRFLPDLGFHLSEGAEWALQMGVALDSEAEEQALLEAD